VIEPFVFTGLPQRVVFGSGSLGRLAEEVRRLGCERALVLSGPVQHELASKVVTLLGPLSVGTFSGARVHTPVLVTAEALAVLGGRGADCLVAAGGGSAIGLSKALARRTGLPQLVVPTTYAGSERTAVVGETEDGQKTTRRADAVLARTVVYDVELTLGLPVGLSATSAVNAIAHAAEALYTREVSPLVVSMAEESVAMLASSLPRIAALPGDPDARADALYGAFLAGTCLACATMGLHHKLCHVLGGAFDLPHAATHAVVLPYALAYNAPSAPGAMARLAGALGAEDPVSGLLRLEERLGVPSSLAELGMPADGVDRVVGTLMEDGVENPRPLEAGPLRDLLGRALRGDGPPAEGWAA